MDRNELVRYQGAVVPPLIATLIALGIDVSELVNPSPIGHRKDGTPIYAIAGGDERGDLGAKIDELIGAIKATGNVRSDANDKAKDADGGRYAAAVDGSKEIADTLAALTRRMDTIDSEDAAKARKAEISDALKDVLKNVRGGSLAATLGNGGADASRVQSRAQSAVKASPVLSAAFRDYEAGEVLQGLMAFKGQDVEGIDMDRINWGKAKLGELGLLWMGVPDSSKATLGATGATGGYVLPNNLVDTVLKPKPQEAVLQNLVTVINGVAVRGVDMPYRLGIPTRMTFQDWGSTKENLNEGYGSYTATLGTIARIYDISKQYARFSSGAAETDVMDELSKAAVLAENYYMIAGAGTGSVGVGDPTVGVYTSLNATPAFLNYKAAKTGAASSSTIAGAFAQACVELMQILAGRNRRPTAILVDHVTFFTAIGQGADAAGFWVNPAGGPTGFTKTESGGLAFWGVPIYYDTNLTTEAASKIAIAAEWSAFKLYRGMEFRIDTSDVAGSRWDNNLIGFRGEEEIGFNAETPVHVGAAQLMTAVIP